jgi:peptide/nickel transport system permease protein
VGGILLTAFAVLTLTFALTFAVPKDPARAIVGPRATVEQVELVRERLGLDDPVAVQYSRYLRSIATGDLGFSFSQRRPVVDVLADRLPYTLLLAVAALAFQLVVGVSVGLLSAARAGGVFDRLALALSVVVIALPGFWIGLVLLYVFGYAWPVLPLGGTDLPAALVLPAITLGAAGAAWTSRVMRSSAYEVLTGDAVRGLRAKGLSPLSIVGRYTARAAAGPVLTMLALDLGLFLGGAVLVESVFNWPGLGLASYQALRSNDLPLLMGCVIVGSLFILVLNLLADIVRTKVDPRVTL